jgi:hypothetical protein
VKAEWDTADEVAAFLGDRGRWPSPTSGDAAKREMGLWLRRQRLDMARGTIDPFRAVYLDFRLPGWRPDQRGRARRVAGDLRVRTRVRRPQTRGPARAVHPRRHRPRRPRPGPVRRVRDDPRRRRAHRPGLDRDRAERAGVVERRGRRVAMVERAPSLRPARSCRGCRGWTRRRGLIENPSLDC